MAIIRGERLSHRQVARFLYQARVTDHWGDAVRLVSGGVWPERAWLESRYGAATAANRVRHLIWLASGKRERDTSGP
jgi:hypothetical protein